MSVLIDIIVPVFGVVGLGFFAARRGWISEAGADGLATFVFNFAIPAMLFRTMATRALPDPIEWEFLIAYFGGAYVVWALGMAISRFGFGRDLATASIAGMSAGYANTVMLGIPLVLMAYGDAGMLPVFLIIAFHSAQMFFVVTVLVEASRGQRGDIGKLIVNVLRGLVLNPVVMGLLAGVAWNIWGLGLPKPVDALLQLLGKAAIPCSLFSLGASLARYRLMGALAEASASSALKLLLHPLAVYLLGAYVFALEPLWLNVAVILAATPVGINVYLFAMRYDTGTAPSATAILLSTVLSVLSLAALLQMLGVR